MVEDEDININEDFKAISYNVIPLLKKAEQMVDNLKNDMREGKKIASLIMNANPFTLGHQYLVEKAANENDVLHLFIVSDDVA